MMKSLKPRVNQHLQTRLLKIKTESDFKKTRFEPNSRFHFVFCGTRSILLKADKASTRKQPKSEVLHKKERNWPTTLARYLSNVRWKEEDEEEAA
jgi:hypothetical protein